MSYGPPAASAAGLGGLRSTRRPLPRDGRKRRIWRATAIAADRGGLHGHRDRITPGACVASWRPATATASPAAERRTRVHEPTAHSRLFLRARDAALRTRDSDTVQAGAAGRPAIASAREASRTARSRWRHRGTLLSDGPAAPVLGGRAGRLTVEPTSTIVVPCGVRWAGPAGTGARGVAVVTLCACWGLAGILSRWMAW